jgi:membrane-bound lytic murein transglycosylase B
MSAFDPKRTLPILLSRIETSVRCAGAVVVAICGLETDFGGDNGRLQTLRVLEGK